MKIAFVSSGSSIHVKKIANYLVNNGYEVTLFTLKNHTKLLHDFDKKVNVKLLPFSGKLGYYLNVPFLRKKLKDGKYDLVNCHYVSGYGTLTRLTKFHPSSLAAFGSDVYIYPYKNKSNKKRVIKNLDYADVITSTSIVMKNKIKEYYKTNREIFVTPFGVDLNIFNSKKRVNNNIFTFGTVKKMEYVYGIDILIKAYAKFQEMIPNSNTRLLIYGRGSGLDDFKALSKNLKMEDKIEFKGFIQNELVPEAYSNMDVACFASRSESFGVAAVEAMACGVPVIASDASGFTEVIENNKTGIIIEKDNIEKFAAAMKDMYLKKKTILKKMGKNGIERVKKEYSFEENMKNYVNAILHAIKK